VTTWDVFTGSASVPPGALAKLAALRAALPAHAVSISSHCPAGSPDDNAPGRVIPARTRYLAVIGRRPP
jgi:hypothetical protein